MPARKKATLPSRRWLCPQYIVALFLLSSVHAIAAEVHSEQSSPPAGSQSVVAAPHQIPVLPPEVATEIEEIEQQIDAVLGRGEERSQEEIQPLIQAAERVVALRTKTQGEQWWETIDSRQRITDLQTWARRTHGQQAELAEEAELSRQVVSLYQEKKYKDALDPATRSISILRKVLGESHLKYAASLNNLALLYKAQGQYAEAKPLLERALGIYEKVLGREHPLTAMSFNNLALLYKAQKQYAEAKPLLERALGIYEKVLGREHPLTGTSLNNLAELYRAQGQYAEAKPLYQRALAINEKVLGLDDAETATSLNNLALLYEAQGQYAEAKPLLERALGIYEKVLGREHPLTATSLNNLAELYRAQGQDAQAKPLYQRALAIREQVLGPEHPHTATSLNNLAELYRAQGQDAQAKPLYQRALAIREQVLGPEHPHTATSLNNLAELYRAQGQYAEAKPLYQRALAINEKVLGLDDAETATSLNNLALLYKAQKQYAEAKPLLERALGIYEKVLGREHPLTATSLNNLAELYRAQGQDAQAKPLYQRALAINEKSLGLEHLHTAASLNNLALLYMGQGAYPEAQPLLARALAIHEGLLGAGHPHTATSLNNLALLYEAQGQYAQVRPLYERALAIREKVLGPDHPDTAMSLNDLAALYWAQGQYAQAKPLYERALAIREKVLGPDHPDTAMSLNNLALLYRDQGQYAKVRPLLERALAIYESLLGSEHPSTAVLLENVAENSMASSPDEAAGLLLRASQAKWRYLTKTFPTLSTQAQQRFLATNGLQRTPHYFWSLFTARPGVDRRFGLQATLLSKQLLAEAGRQESSAMRQVLADAAPAWRALWHERDGLRRRYATLAFQSSPDSALQQSLRGSPDAGAVQAIGQLTVRLEQLEARLRSESPAYARQAQLDETSVAQVMKSLQATHALLEYVQFQPYDQKTKKLTDSRHYGVYVVRGDKTPVVAVDLGEAASIDAAIRQFHAGMREIINKVNNEMTPSPAQFRKSEAALAQWSSKLRTWIWQPLEPHLRGVTRVYVAPEGQLSLLPFEVLANKTKKKEWQYLVEEQELVYLNTGRDLARLALTAKTQHAAPTKTKTAVLIGNPAFDASPQHVARAVAAMPMTPPTLMAQGDSRGGVPTLGTTAGNGSQRLQVPRNWEPVPALGALLNHAQHQLTRANWSVITVQQEQAVEEAVLRVQAPQILQVATHGYLLDHVGWETNSWDNPLLRSMLLFSGVNQAKDGHTVFYRMGKDLLSPAEAEQRGLTPEQLQAGWLDVGDGVLTAYEVTGMNLQGTELVNLTACETGLGQITPDGVAGLRQAFFLAGARSLTTSLWEVPAEETTTQIEAFYTRWLGTKTSAKTKTTQTKKANQPAITRYQAFRQTQLAALASARKDWNGAGHPFFWAGTIYLGDPGDLPVLDDSR